MLLIISNLARLLDFSGAACWMVSRYPGQRHDDIDRCGIGRDLQIEIDR
jgi:hypothetical protein